MRPKIHLTEDEKRDIAISIVDDLVEEGIIPNCIDTDNEAEFITQDIIVKHLTN